MVSTDQFRRMLRAERLVAIVRGRDPRASIDCVRVLADHGVRLVEISLTTTDALRVIEAAAAADVDIHLGAGTLRTAQDARDARDAGATFAVTPALTPGAEEAAALGLPVLAGSLSPTEISNAHQSGYIPKLFPAAAVGVDYLRALREPFPEIDLVPVGGVDTEAAARYLAAGALAVGVGSPLLGDAAHGGDLHALAVRAARFRSVVDSMRLS